MSRLTPGSSSRDNPSSHLDEDRILDFLLNLLPAGEVAAIGRHLRVCAECEERARRRGALMERSRAGYESVVAAAEAVGATAATGPPRIMGVLRRWRTAIRRPQFSWAMATGVAALAVFAVTWFRPSKNVVYPTTAEWLTPASGPASVRRSDPTQRDAALTAGLEAYDRRDLTTAIEALSAARATGSLETMRRIFLGSALTHSGDYRGAVEALSGCGLENVPEPWRGESEWTLLVALHQARDDAAADSLLRTLAAENSSVGARARRLLGRPR